MRTHGSIDRGARRLVAAGLLAVWLAACATPAPTLGPSNPPGPPATPAGEPLDVETLAASAGDLDGQSATATGFLLIAGDRARLCAMTLESYPPQCGGAAVRVLGAIPADVLSALERTNDPTLAQAIWGQVTITGTVAATGADGQPTLTVDTITVNPPIEG